MSDTDQLEEELASNPEQLASHDPSVEGVQVADTSDTPWVNDGAPASQSPSPMDETPVRPDDSQEDQDARPADFLTDFDQKLADIVGAPGDQEKLASYPGDEPTPDSDTAPPMSTSDRVAAYIRAKQAAANPTTSSAVPSTAPNLIQQMMDKYGSDQNPELNDAALKQAQQNANTSRLGVNIARAFNTMATVSNGLRPDDAAFNALDAQTGQGVANIEARRKQAEQNLANDQNVLKMVDTQLSTQNLAQNMDPNSNATRAMRAVLKKINPDMANIPGFDQMSMVDLKNNYVPLIEAKAKMDMAKAQQDFNNNYKLNNFGFKVNQAADRQVQQGQNSLNKDANYVRANKSLVDTSSALDTLELAKSNPIAYQAQAMDVAKAVLDGAGRLSQAEISQYAGGSQALLARVNQIQQQAMSGTISDGNYQWSKQLLQHLHDSAQNSVNTIQKQYAGQLSARNGANSDKSLQLVTGNPNAKADQSASGPYASKVGTTFTDKASGKQYKIINAHGDIQPISGPTTAPNQGS